MISKLAADGDAVLKATSSSSLLSAHAVHRANGDVDVMLINKDPNNATTVSLSYTGFTPGSATPTVYSYLKNATSITSATTGTGTTQTVPAYSVVVVQVHAGSGGGPGPGSGACSVSYTKNEWSGGMTGSVTVTNTGSQAVNGWKLAFAFPGDTTITSSWNAAVTQSGANVTASNMSYNTSIPAGGNVQFGFQATWKTSDAVPTAYTLNGQTGTTSGPAPSGDAPPRGVAGGRQASLLLLR
jgi:cellulase/cellobiase CelA1